MNSMFLKTFFFYFYYIENVHSSISSLLWIDSPSTLWETLVDQATGIVFVSENRHSLLCCCRNTAWLSSVQMTDMNSLGDHSYRTPS